MKEKPKKKSKSENVGPDLHFRKKRMKSKKPTKAESMSRSGVKPKKKA